MKRTKLPIFTWLIIISCVLAYLWQINILHAPENIEPWLRQYLIPCSRTALDEKLWYTSLSYAWLHTTPMHLINNMLLFLSIGPIIERSFGHIRFLTSYILGAIAGACTFAYARPAADPQMLIGASGAVFSMVGTYLIALYKAKNQPGIPYQTRTYLASRFHATIKLITWNLIYGIFLTIGVSNMAHIGGLIAGMLVGVILIKPAKAHNAPKPLKEAVQQIRKVQR